MHTPNDNMQMREFLESQLKNSLATIVRLSADEHLLDALEGAALATAAALRAGKKLMTAGNGGSAADAQHVAAEFVGRLSTDRPPLRAIALTTDTSCLTGIGNDYGFECVFDRQLEALGQTGDVFLAISTSGKSLNILRALERCRAMGIVTVGFTGSAGGRMLELCDHRIVVPSASTQNIQEANLVLEHLFCGLAERYLLGEGRFE
jgi:D-sedoheptulose 7-phosphate isomerase